MDSVQSASPAVQLDELTFDELRTRVAAKQAHAKPGDRKGWEELDSLIVDLSELEKDDVLVRARRWRLTRVAVEGFRGALEQTVLSIGANSGLVVISGENGAGKSTLIEALRMSLYGEIGEPHIRNASRANSLWTSSNEVHRDAESAQVEVTLIDEESGDRLTIKAAHDSAGVVRTATLDVNGTATEFAADDPAWNPWTSTVQSSLPIFAYAELAAELGQASELHMWLTSCLAMDRCSSTLGVAITSRLGIATTAAQTLSASIKKAREAIDTIDVEASLPNESAPAIDWPTLELAGDVNGWLKANKLDGASVEGQLVRQSEVQTCKELAQLFLDSQLAVSRATTATFGPAIDGSLLDLDKAAQDSVQTSNIIECPVCGSDANDWIAHLHAFAANSEKASGAIRTQKQLAARFSRDIVEVLERGVKALEGIEEHQALSAAANSRAGECRTRIVAGDTSSTEALAVLTECATWLVEGPGPAFLAAVLERAGEVSQWASRRANAAAPLIPVVAEHGPAARKEGILKDARNKFTSLSREIREERSATLELLLSPAVATLLGDVGIHVTGLSINKAKTGAELGLADENGSQVLLSHLSAGQRNALILGPILARIGSGNFSFTIIDDPVHAFDEFRVDQLARTLSDMTDSTQLVVATHDERFVEYLRVFGPPSSRFLRVERVPPGLISITDTHMPWDELATFASDLIASETGTLPSGLVRDVRALLRAAIDECVEWIGIATQHSANPGDATNLQQRLNRAKTTSDRWETVKGALAAVPGATKSIGKVDRALPDALQLWNNASHGKGCDSVKVETMRNEIRLLRAITKSISVARRQISA